MNIGEIGLIIFVGINTVIAGWIMSMPYRK